MMKRIDKGGNTVQRSDLHGQSRALTAFAIMTAVIVVFAWQWSSRTDPPASAIGDIELEATVVVAIDGAVGTPGVYMLPGDARVQNVITAAGGITSDADLSVVNPAARVHDGDRVVIPFKSTPVPTIDPSRPTAEGEIVPSVAAGPLNINTASADELDELPGIGKVIAQRIVAYRESHGAFSSVDELAEVNGISERMVDDLRPLITTGP
jgi:competence protein ComEA